MVATFKKQLEHISPANWGMTWVVWCCNFQKRLFQIFCCLYCYLYWRKIHISLLLEKKNLNTISSKKIFSFCFDFEIHFCVEKKKCIERIRNINNWMTKDTKKLISTVRLEAKVWMMIDDWWTYYFK